MKYLAKTRLGSAGRYSLEVFVTVLTSVTVLAHRPGQRECLLQTLPGGISHRPQQRSVVPFQGRVGMRGCGCGFFLFFAPPFFIGRLRGLLFLPIVSNVSQWHKPPLFHFQLAVTNGGEIKASLLDATRAQASSFSYHRQGAFIKAGCNKTLIK